MRMRARGKEWARRCARRRPRAARRYVQRGLRRRLHGDLRPSAPWTRGHPSARARPWPSSGVFAPLRASGRHPARDRDRRCRACDQASSASSAGVVAADVSGEITSHADLPRTCASFLIDGTHFHCPTHPLMSPTANQLMEHTCIRTTRSQLAEIARVLKPGGRYVYITPNPPVGPA